jgi:succinate--hydroxymethylglutarate CoA-transferase
MAHYNQQMSSFGVLARAAPYVRSRCAGRGLMGLQRRQWRGIATKEVNEKLPLAGIRVLDMTRVLAGVRHC